MEAYDRTNRGGFRDERGPMMDLMDMRVDMGGNMGGNLGGNIGGNMGGNMGGGGGRGGGVGGGGGRWQGANDRNRQDDFPNKRRRY